MKVKLYTSLSGIKNAVEGKRVVAFDKPTQLEDIEITVDVHTIESVEDFGMVVISPRPAIKWDATMQQFMME